LWFKEDWDMGTKIIFESIPAHNVHLEPESKTAEKGQRQEK
jgi:hypothetical protein